MMVCQLNYQYKPFVSNFNPEKHMHKNHILRKIEGEINFDFILGTIQLTQLSPMCFDRHSGYSVICQNCWVLESY